MKILVINPNISADVSALIEREAQRSALPDTELTVMTAAFGVAYIETRAEALIGGYAAMQLAAEFYHDFDAVVVAAFGDPGLEALREMLPIPVVGMTEAALASASLQGGRYSIIAISQRIQAWYRECAERHGFSKRLASIRALNEPLQHIGRVQENQGEQLIALAGDAIDRDGADVLIMAGAPLAGLARSVADRIPVPTLDGVTCAIHQAQALVMMGGSSRTTGSYAAPPQKPCKGLPPAVAAMIGRELSDH